MAGDKRRQLTRRQFIADVTASATVMLVSKSAVGSQVSRWQPLPIGAGGLISGIRIAPDGRKIIRTDTHGEYVCDTVDTTWKQRLLSTTMPAASVRYQANGDLRHTEGVVEVAIAPSNSSRLYKFYRGQIYKSDDFGAHWTLTSFSTVSDSDNHANSAIKLYGPKVAVKPDNADVLYVGTATNGLRFSSDAGSTWSTVSTAEVPDATAVQGYCIVFDKTNANRVWIGSYGNGWYVSTTSGSGGGFSAVGGAPTTFRTAKCDQNGRLYVCVNGTDSLRRYDGRSWMPLAFNKSSGNEERAQCVAINPRDADHIVCIIDSGHWSVSNDGGFTWTGINFTQHSLSATGIPWLQYTAPGVNQYMTATECDFCPITGRLYLAAGVGVWWTTDFEGTHQWQQQSVGIEQLVVNQILSRTDGYKLVVCWDRPVFRVNGTNFPSDWGPEHDTEINAGWSIDCAPSNEDFVVVLANWFGVEKSSYSRDGGQTWMQFPSYPPLQSNALINGTIAVGSETNFVWIPCNGGGRPYYTTDGGRTWNLWNTPTGVPTGTGDIGIGFAFFLNAKFLCKDWVSGLFYLYLSGTEADHSYAGVYTSPTGQIWTKVNSDRLANGGANFRMDAVPGNEGHLFRTAGEVGGSISGQFQKSTDGGASWSSVPNMTEVRAFGFGAIASGASYPTLYVFGWRDGTRPAIWRTTNANQARPTWTMVGTNEFPSNSLDAITWVSGDKSDADKCYVGMRGSGALQYG